MLQLLLLLLAPLRLRQAPLGKRQRAVTSLIINALILTASADSAAAITAPITATATATTLLANNAAAFSQNNFEAPKRDVRAATAVIQNYYRRQAPQAVNAAGRVEEGAAATSYANYVGGTARTAATTLPQLQLATATGFIPTTLTAAGQHYATAATADALPATATTNEGYNAPQANFDYEEDNAADYEPTTADGYATYGRDVAVGMHQQPNLRQHESTSNADGNSYAAYAATQAFQQSFPPAALQPQSNHYLRSFDADGFLEYQQQQQQQQHSIATPTTYQRNNDYLRHFYKQLDEDERYEDEQQRDTRNGQRVAEPSQLQVRIADSSGRHIDPAALNNAAADDNTDAQSQHYYAPHLTELRQDDAATNHILQHLQHQLHQQQQQFAALQHHLLLHEQHLQQQQQHAVQPLHAPHTAIHHIHPLHSALHHPVHQLPGPQAPHAVHSVAHTLPPITSTVHHTPASATAVAGIPLAKHIHITKHIPVHHYQQLQVPYNQTVPIEIPRPVITTVPRPVAIQVPVHKTIAVPKLEDVRIPIEKVRPFPVERPVPYIVERRVPYRVEKQVATPVYYPYPIKVPIIQTVVHKVPQRTHHHPLPHHYAGNHFG